MRRGTAYNHHGVFPVNTQVIGNSAVKRFLYLTNYIMFKMLVRRLVIAGRPRYFGETPLTER